MYREKDQPRGLWVSPQLGLVHQQSGQCREAAHRHPHGVQPPAGDPHHGAEEPTHPPAPLLRPLLSIHPHVWPSGQTAGGGPERHHCGARQSTRRHRVVCQGKEQWYVWWTKTRTCEWLYSYNPVLEIQSYFLVDQRKSCTSTENYEMTHEVYY